MNRSELINHLIYQRKAQRYLEIGVHEPFHNFSHIRCLHKSTSFPGTSDNFFARNRERFDIILIDGIHTEEQSLKDIRHAFDCLAKDGIIVLHDCMPPDAWHQREPEDYREGENWNGASWKAALRIFNESPYKCFLLDMDWGCGLIDSSRSQSPERKDLPVSLNYETHYPWLLRYKKTVAAFFREQVTVFYHLACMGNWRQVFEEQMLQLTQNGFLRVKLTVLGTDEDLQWVRSTCDRLRLDFEVLFHATEMSCFEAPAMKAIEAHARQSDGYVLYLHSKGVSNPAHEPKAKWRRLMMRELVENWEKCLLQLPQYDLVGVNWRDMPPISHFCGNFWYASTRYLRQLSDFTRYYENPRFRIGDHFNNKRLGCEFWIGSSGKSPRLLSLVCRNVDFCNDEYWRSR